MSRPAPTDEDLVRRIQESPRGDLRAFDELVARHERRVVTNCRYLSGSPADARDLAQEVLIKAYFGLDRFEGRASFRTWLNRIKANHCINFVQRKRRHALDIDDPSIGADEALAVQPSAPGVVEGMEERERIRMVLEGMADTLRIPLIMRDMDGLAYQEIAEELGIGLSAVKMRILRGREEFRERYRALSEEETPGNGGGPASRSPAEPSRGASR